MNLDLHVQEDHAGGAVIGSNGTLHCNEEFEYGHDVIRAAFSKVPANTKYAPAPSSAWCEVCQLVTNKLGLDVMLSNLLATKRDVQSKKNTDRVDAETLVNWRDGYIAESYV